MTAFGAWRLALGAWRLALGAWRLAFGVWRLAFGVWRLERFLGLGPRLESLLHFAPLFPTPSDHTDCSLLTNHFSPITVRRLAFGAVNVPGATGAIGIPGNVVVIAVAAFRWMMNKKNNEIPIIRKIRN